MCLASHCQWPVALLYLPLINCNQVEELSVVMVVVLGSKLLSMTQCPHVMVSE